MLVLVSAYWLHKDLKPRIPLKVLSDRWQIGVLAGWSYRGCDRAVRWWCDVQNLWVPSNSWQMSSSRSYNVARATLWVALTVKKNNVLLHTKTLTLYINTQTQMLTQISNTHNPDANALSHWELKNEFYAKSFYTVDSPFFKLWSKSHRGHVKWKIGVTVLGKHVHTHTLHPSVALFSHTHCFPWVLLSVRCSLTGRDLQ